MVKPNGFELLQLIQLRQPTNLTAETIEFLKASCQRHTLSLLSVNAVACKNCHSSLTRAERPDSPGRIAVRSNAQLRGELILARVLLGKE